MNDGLIDFGNRRFYEARFSKHLGDASYRILLVVSIFGVASAVALGFGHHKGLGLLLASPAIFCYMLAVWWKRYLAVLPPHGTDLAGVLSVDVLSRLKRNMTLNPQTMWAALQDHWQALFFADHLLLGSDTIASHLSTEPAELQYAVQLAVQEAQKNEDPVVEPGFIVAGMLLASAPLRELLVEQKAKPDDIESIANWLGRNIKETRRVKTNAGGIGRDWAFGYTPQLDRFGHNVTESITQEGAHYGWLTNSEGVQAIDGAFNNRASAVALIGADGIGKTTTVHALAQRLIEGNTSQALAFHQVVSLNASDITSNAHAQGELEQIMIGLANEANRAGHIILFFDNAQLFFGGGPGTFDATQILMSIVESHSVPIILALTPSDYQRLRAQNQSLASLLTPVMLQEMPEAGVMRVLEDSAVTIQNQDHVLVAYEALHEAYRLSGRYEQEEAYPGKAIKLLKQAVAHSDHGLVNAVSVQQAIEQTRGVKVGTAGTTEADTLLHLEDTIHQRMINQTHAVGVVSNALRRARAGVANPKRPIGSFLFLGPTGVGKTELGKAIAATYFGNETNMIRLDMSEYQRPEDVARLLSNGREETRSLILAVRAQPFSVVLLDEIEKAHPNILNLLLQMLDEGQLTDSEGKGVSFKDCIIIVTSNAGAQTIRDRVEKGEALESFQAEFTNELINSGQFKPELLNRFDEIVLFRPLTPEELLQVVALMMNEVNKTLSSQNITLELTPAAMQQIVAVGYDPRMGARPMRRALQRAVEDTVAQRILRNEAKAGDHLVLDVGDLNTT